MPSEVSHTPFPNSHIPAPSVRTLEVVQKKPDLVPVLQIGAGGPVLGQTGSGQDPVMAKPAVLALPTT